MADTVFLVPGMGMLRLESSPEGSGLAYEQSEIPSANNGKPDSPEI